MFGKADKKSSGKRKRDLSPPPKGNNKKAADKSHQKSGDRSVPKKQLDADAEADAAAAAEASVEANTKVSADKNPSSSRGGTGSAATRLSEARQKVKEASAKFTKAKFTKAASAADKSGQAGKKNPRLSLLPPPQVARLEPSPRLPPIVAGLVISPRHTSPSTTTTRPRTATTTAMLTGKASTASPTGQQSPPQQV